MVTFNSGTGSQGFQALMQRPQAGTLDFTSFARGAAIADDMNWRDRIRSLDEDRLRRTQEDELHDRQARTYMASLLTNMQTAASAGVDPTDFFIQQREQILADPAYQNMPAEVQHQVINRLGNSVALQMQSLMNAGDTQGISRLADAYGLTTPVNQPMLAGSAGDYAGQIDAINQMYGSDIQLSPDGSTVAMNGMTMPANAAIATLNAAGNRPEALQGAMYQWTTSQDYRARLTDALNRSGLDEFQLPLNTNLGAQPEADWRSAVSPQPAGVNPQPTGMPTPEVHSPMPTDLSQAPRGVQAVPQQPQQETPPVGLWQLIKQTQGLPETQSQGVASMPARMDPQWLNM